MEYRYIIYLRHLLTKVCILRWIPFVTSQVSHPYKSTDFTQALNILILVSFRNDLQDTIYCSNLTTFDIWGATKPNGHCTYNASSSCVRTTPLAVEKQYYILSAHLQPLLFSMQCAFRHVAICGRYNSTVFFPHYFINGATFFFFKKKSLNNKICLCEIFPILRKIRLDIVIKAWVDDSINWLHL